VRRLQAQREREASAQQKRAAPPPGPAAPPDDLDLELQQLRAAAADGGDATGPAAAPGADVARPPFPPAGLGVAPAFAPAAPCGASGGKAADAAVRLVAGAPVDEETGEAALAAWGFLGTFGELLGLRVPTVGALAAAVAGGQRHPLWAALHVALVRVVQADMEDAHASGVLQVRGSCERGHCSSVACCSSAPSRRRAVPTRLRAAEGRYCAPRAGWAARAARPGARAILHWRPPTPCGPDFGRLGPCRSQAVGQLHFADQARVAAAQALEEAWAWGFDPHQWRAHLGPDTWPEVLRQLATACGAGPKRTQRALDAGGPGADVAAPLGADAGGGAAAGAGGDGGGTGGADGPIGPQPGGRDDLVVYRYPDGTVARHKIPPRFGNVRTVKGACWRVSHGAEGRRCGGVPPGGV
jgi:hypothetical protein